MNRWITLIVISALGGCGGGSDTISNESNVPADLTAVPSAPLTVTAPTMTVDAAPVTPPANADDIGTVTLSPLDLELRDIIAAEQLAPVSAAARELESINSPLAELGKLLFFSTHLGGEQDAACVSCHHPVLGGGDALSLSVGVHAVDSAGASDADLLGPGRHSGAPGTFPLVPRNAPTVFNAGLWDRGMFWDSRIASVGNATRANGSAGGIVTPESNATNQPDLSLPVATTLPAAQARFPVTSAAEMRGNFASDTNSETLRSSLAARLADPSGNWATLFEDTFGDADVTFNRIGEAIGAYERSMNFTDTPWNSYLAGNMDALDAQQKEGAVLFFTPVERGGAGCSRCHSGDNFSDERHHLVAFPQVTDDRGRETVTDDGRDRYHFRTPSLLNISTTGPYGHSGLFENLEDVVRHYDNPRRSIDRLFGAQDGTPFVQVAPVCRLPQIERMTDASGATCETLLTDAFVNSELTLQRLQQGDNVSNPLGPTPNLNNNDVALLLGFLEALNDPCASDRDCLDPWIVDADDLASYPDDSALVAHDEAKLNY